jgi:hypothetical protein
MALGQSLPLFRNFFNFLGVFGKNVQKTPQNFSSLKNQNSSFEKFLDTLLSHGKKGDFHEISTPFIQTKKAI